MPMGGRVVVVARDTGKRRGVSAGFLLCRFSGMGFLRTQPCLRREQIDETTQRSFPACSLYHALLEKANRYTMGVPNGRCRNTRFPERLSTAWVKRNPFPANHGVTASVPTTYGTGCREEAECGRLPGAGQLVRVGGAKS